MGGLHFNSIKLVGFKSFVEPTVFGIEPGLTGIVGPNGCGKSNLLEAIRWVMGANSAKAMRASGMDDVIFSGTKTRPGRGQASVTLKIDNRARIAPPIFNDDDELEISRIITKGSGSKYKVNGKTVRAKDIQLLFADASTGANSPALVRQGQISELIAAKPSNRRRILEEAAGISGLHTRRHEAELRLRAAENNLDRLEDILGQIEAQLLSLRRQSRQASRYKRLAGEIREYKALLWLRRWELALAALEGTQSALKESEAKVADLTGQVAAFTTALSDISVKIEPLREEQIIAAAVCGRLNAAKEALDNDAQAAQSEIKKLEGRLDFLRGDIEREDGIVADAKSAHDRLSEEFESLKATKDMSAAMAQAEQTAAKFITERTACEQKIAELTRRSAEYTAQKSSAERDHVQVQQQISGFSREIDGVKEKLEALIKQQKPDNEQSLFTASMTSASDILDQARGVEQKAIEDRQSAEQAERDTRDQLATHKQNLSEISAQHKAISALVNSARGDSHWPTALENISVEKGYEAAIAAAFGDDLDAGLDGDIPMLWGGADTPMQSLPDGVKSLGGFVKAPDALLARLSQIGVVDGDGKELAKSLKPGQRLVSITGDLWRWDGYWASGDLPSTATLKLENKNTLADLEDQLPPLQSALDTAHSNWQTAKDNRARCEDAARAARKTLPDLEREVRQAQSLLAQFETDQARRTEQKTAVEDRLSRLNEQMGVAQNNLREAAHALEQFGDNAELEAELEQASQVLETARAKASEASAAHHALANEVQTRANRLSAVESELEAWGGRSKQAAERIKSLQGREAETKLALDNANASPDEFAKKQQTLLSELSMAEKRRNTASDALVAIETALRTADGQLRAGEQALGSAREARAGAGERHIAAGERKDEVMARIEENLECPPEGLKEIFEELSADNKMGEHDIERKLERLSRERENMGAVNLRADEEANEQEERLTALNDERQDLVAAIARLREGIESLNTEGRERLLKAFDVVNGHFGRLFTTLFGGGNANLALTESDDPLQAGLEVMVSPPGKKLGSMTLMSGGEQALTATALIFAVFLSNPAPICVLDEVDAPLDDANVERYCDLLDEMCKNTETKFIAITHNPVTMARMDRLFGVTMAEKGVSQLVSIDLGQAEKLTA